MTSFSAMRSMITMISLGVALALSGCDPDCEKPHEEEPSQEDPVVRSEGAAMEVGAGVDATSAGAIAAIADSLVMVMSEEQAMTALGEEPDLYFTSFDRPCWDADRVDTGTLEIDFAGCADEGISGMATLTWDGDGHASLAFDDETFTFHGNDVDGAVEMDRLGLHPLELTVYTGAQTPLSVFSPATAKRGEVNMGGTLVVDRSGGAATLVATGTTAVFTNADDNEADDDEAPLAHNAFVVGGHSAQTAGEDPLTWTLPMDDCTRASGGTIVSESTLQMDEITIDLDHFVDTGIDHFLPTEIQVQDVVYDGEMRVEYTGGCGEREACFTANDIQATIPLDKAHIADVVAEVCGNWDEDCGQLLWLIDTFLPEVIQVDVQDHDFCDAAEAALDEIDG